MPPTSGSLPGRSPAATPLLHATPRWVPSVLVAVLAATGAALVAYAAFPDVGVRTALYAASQLVSAGVFTAGVFTSRRGFRRDWLIMLAATGVWVLCTGLVAFDLDDEGMPRSWVTSISLSLLAYVLMTVGAVRLARRDGFARGSAVWLDGAALLGATLLGWWVLIGHEMAVHAGRLDAGTIVAGLVPLGDVVLISAAPALANSRAAHSLSSRALLAFALFGLVGDLGFARLTLGHEVFHDTAIPALWMLQYASGAVAALGSGRPAPREQGRVSLPWIVVVIAAVVAPALVGGYAAVVPGDDLVIAPDTFAALAAGTIALVAVVSVRITMLVRRIERQAADLEHAARTDELTQLPNRRAGDRLLDEAISVAHGYPGADLAGGRTGRLCIAILDLDHFKQFNDTYGHQPGDSLLRACARAWSEGLPPGATVFRFGGEEFVVVMPGATPSDAEVVLDRLHAVTPSGQTFSAGLAVLRPGDDRHALLGRADAGLYEAKAAGRNRTVQAA